MTDYNGEGHSARVSSLTTKDELMGFTCEVEVGSTVVVFPSNLTVFKNYNVEAQKFHEKVMVWALVGSHDGYVPAECVEWLGKEKDLKRLTRVH